MKNFKLKLLVLLVSLVNFSLVAQVDIISSNARIDIRSSVEILTDSSGTLAFQDVISSNKFIKAKPTVINLDVTPYVHWLKFQIKNETETEDLLLEVNNPTLDIVDFYTISADGKVNSIESGEVQKISERKYNHQNFIFDIKIPQGATETYFLKVKCGDISIIPLSVGTSKVILESQIIKELVFGIYAGIIIVMFLYNLFIYFTVRDKNYLYYVVYIISVGLVQLMLQGYTYKYLWPGYPWFANQSIVLFAALAGIAIALFARYFLQVKKYTPILNKGFTVIIITYIISIPLRAFGYDNLSYKIVDALAGITCLYILIVAIIIVRRDYRPAKFFLLAWLVFLVGIIIFVLRNFGILPYNNFTSYIMPIGNAIEVVLLSFALADRINLLKKEKEESQIKVLEALKENERITTEQNIVLEKKVKERTLELETSNKNLKDAQAQLVDAEKMASLGQLTAGIAHEINNPINFVISNIKPLKRDVEEILYLLSRYNDIQDDKNFSNKLKEITDLKEKLDADYLISEINLLLKGIDEGASRTSEIVKGLQNFSRLDEDDMKMANIHEGIDATLSLLNNNIIRAKINLVKKYANLPQIDCYPGKLNQVFMNILNNAIQAIEASNTNNGEIIITTSLNEKIVRISIKDNGPGMTEEVKRRIFEPFFTTKNVGEGSGLGLSIVYGIIEKHKGEITVETAPGKGTEFIILLPFQ